MDIDEPVEVGYCADEGGVREDVVRENGGGEFDVEGAMVFEDAGEEVEGGGTSGWTAMPSL